MYLQLFKENILFAIHALTNNKLRTFLSLLGITIGIFAIISVFTIVDSLEKNLRDDVSALGDDVVFIQKWPWEGGGPNYPWWKYLNRPLPKPSELPEVQKRCKSAYAASFQVSSKVVVKQESNSVENVEFVAVSHDYDKTRTLQFKDGRYFTDAESESGKNIIILGHSVANALFGEDSDPIGKSVKIYGHKFNVIGVLNKKGESILGNNEDTQVIIPLNYARTVIDVDDEGLDPFIMVRAKSGVTLDQLVDELTGIMRAIRKINPQEEDNFALNKTSLISREFDQLFNILGTAGWIIGGFSILVGGFGIANIMFVSVKERTNIIGIQKSLGAKNYFILLQFLTESVFLSLIGGVIGLIIIYTGTFIIGDSFGMTVYLSGGNVILGLTISILIGIISGFVPAYTASQLDPVEAIRTGI